MKKLALFTLVLSLITQVQAQKTGSLEEYKCGHLRHQNVISASSEKMALYDVNFYFLDIEATNQSTAVNGSTTIGATTKNENLNEFVIELIFSFTNDIIGLN